MRLKVRPADFRVEEVLEPPPPEPAGAFAIYRVSKRRLPALEAVARLASLLGVAARDVQFAGLKDARAETTQLASVKLAAGRGLPRPEAAPDLVLEPLHRAARPVDRRRLVANRFALVVRDLGPVEVAALPLRLEALLRDGLPDYFDDQRLGGESPERGFVAGRLAEGRLEEALRLQIAHPSPKDPRLERLEKKAIAARFGQWAEIAGDVKGEAAPIVRRLARAPNDILGAFAALDLRLRALIVARFQSWLWNEEVARRLHAELPAGRRFEVMYRGGSLVFWRALEDGERTRLAAARVPWPAVTVPPRLGVRPARGDRALLVRPGGLEAAADEPDEAFPGRRKVALRFTLPRGSYATLVAKRLFYEPEAPRS